jgi:hypothetical protein
MKSHLQSLSKFLRPSRKTMLLIVVFALATLLLSTAISLWLYKPIAETFYQTFNRQLPSSVNIKTIGLKVYWDSNLTNESTMVTWPLALPGESYNTTLYFQSASNVNTYLELETTNWVFLNSNGAIVSGPSNNNTNFINLTWDYSNTVLSPKQIVPVTLTLSIDNSANMLEFLIDNQVTQFNFDMIISAKPTSQP